MHILFRCSCGKKLKANSELAGRRTRCSHCNAIVTIPASASAEPPPAEPAPVERRVETGFLVNTDFGEVGALLDHPRPGGDGKPNQPGRPAGR